MNIAADQLRTIVERIERLHQAKADINDDLKMVYSEAKANGFDAKAIRQIVKERGADKGELSEFEAIVDLYRSALGMALAHAHDAREEA